MHSRSRQEQQSSGTGFSLCLQRQSSIPYFITGYTCHSLDKSPGVSNPEKVTSATLAAFKVARTAAVKATETPV